VKEEALTYNAQGLLASHPDTSESGNEAAML